MKAFLAGKTAIAALTICAAITLAVSPAHAGLQAENVLTPVPEGFKMGWQGNSPALTQQEFVPEAETVDDWSRMVTVQIYHGAFNVTPDDFAQHFVQNLAGACPDLKSGKIVDGTENGYAFSIWGVSCPLNPQTHKPEAFFMKTIHGDDAIYVVQYAYRQALTNKLGEPAMDYLRKVVVCDTRRTDRACPAGM